MLIQQRGTGSLAIVEAATGDDCVTSMEEALGLIGELPTWDGGHDDEAP